MKMHIGVDKATGIIHTVVTTPANVHDVTKADELRRPDDWEVIGDSEMCIRDRTEENVFIQSGLLSDSPHSEYKKKPFELSRWDYTIKGDGIGLHELLSLIHI